MVAELSRVPVEVLTVVTAACINVSTYSFNFSKTGSKPEQTGLILSVDYEYFTKNKGLLIFLTLRLILY